jgi:hypothetical protein
VAHTEEVRGDFAVAAVIRPDSKGLTEPVSLKWQSLWHLDCVGRCPRTTRCSMYVDAEVSRHVVVVSIRQGLGVRYCS